MFPAAWSSFNRSVMLGWKNWPCNAPCCRCCLHTILRPFSSTPLYFATNPARCEGCKSVQTCAKVCKGVQRCAKVFESLQKCARWLKSTSQKKGNCWWQDLAFVTASCAVYSRSTGHAQMLHYVALCTPSSRDADELLGCSPSMSVLAAQSLILPASWHSATGMQNDALRCTKYQTSTLRQTWDFAL